MYKSVWQLIVRFLSLALMLGLMSGCATVHEMGVNKATTSLDLKGKALLLMSLQVANGYKPDYQPTVNVVYFETGAADSKEKRHNFKPDLEGTIVNSEGARYLLRMELEPGKYVLRGAGCMYRSFMLLGSCFMPIHADVEAKADTITYLGSAHGVTRERGEGEFRAGPMIPLIDQAVTGFSRSTFDVELSDNREEDLKAYRLLFPALSTADIQFNILPPFDRPRAQVWWETDGNSEKGVVDVQPQTQTVAKDEPGL
jgi:hypothetical protein